MSQDNLPKIESVIEKLRASLNFNTLEQTPVKIVESQRTVKVSSSLNARPTHLSQHKPKHFIFKSLDATQNKFNSTQRSSDMSYKTTRLKD